MNAKKMTKQDMLLQYIKTINEKHYRNFNANNYSIDVLFALNFICIANKNALSTMLSMLKKNGLICVYDDDDGYCLTIAGRNYINIGHWSDDFQDVIDNYLSMNADEVEEHEDDEPEYELADDEDEEPSIDNSAYDAAMKAYDAAMDAYRAAMDVYKIAIGA